MESAYQVRKLVANTAAAQPFPRIRMAQGGSHGPDTPNYERLIQYCRRAGRGGGRNRKIGSADIPQLAVATPTVANIIIGARNEEQLKQNLGAVGWNLTVDQVKELDVASEVDPYILTGTSGRIPG